MKNNQITIIIGTIVFFIYLALSSVFIVYEGSQAMILQFGKVVNKSILNSGMHFKLPFIQQIVFFEKRILNILIESKEMIAADQKRVIVDAYVKYQIINPLKFYQTVGNEMSLKDRLSPIVEARLREQIGKVSLICLLSECRTETMDIIQDATNVQSERFGIKIIDVRVKKTDLPDINSEAIFRRMQTERSKEAREIRAQGKEEANKIRANAEKDHVVIIADANMQSSILKGQADAHATSIYNDAFGKDPEFFDFIRHMEMYKKSLKEKNTKIIMSGEDDFLSFLQNKKNGNIK